MASVDDLALFGDDGLICSVKKGIEQHFRITDLGLLTHFLGVKKTEIRNGSLSLTQKPLIEKLLGEANMLQWKPCSSPLPMSHILYENRMPLNTEELEEMKFVPYSNILGSLLHLSTRTKPDLSTAVSMLGKFQAAPAPRHWKAMNDVLRYLKGIANFGLHYFNHSNT